jgi:predicted outer membrane repeat protein
MGIATGSITNCTFSQNSAGRNGGAVYIDGEDGSAMLSISSCTFSQNSASNSGGGIYVSADGGAAAIQLSNNIFKTGTSGANIVNSAGTIISQGHNLSSDNGGGYLTGAGDQVNTDPMLDPAGLQNNGGPTPTIALQAGSPAINAGDPNAPPRDQRYYIRSGAPDIGAFEFGGTPVPVQLVNAVSIKTHGGAGSFSINLPLSGSVGIECRDGGTNMHTIVFTFANTLTSVGGAAVSSGTGTVSSSGIGADAHEYIVNLTAVTNAQVITVN